MTQDLLPDEYLLTQLTSLAKQAGVEGIEEQTRLNRHLFWLKKDSREFKIEFVFYPFPSIERPKKIEQFGVKIDSLKDILTNKTHAVFERGEPKDAFDIYCILQQEDINLDWALKWVKKKFGVEIDAVLLASRLLEASDRLAEIKPLIIKPENYNIQEIKSFFENQALLHLRTQIKE